MTGSLARRLDSLIAEIAAYEVVLADPAARAALGHLKGLAKSIRGGLAEGCPEPGPLPAVTGNGLTAREAEILRLVRDGDTNKEIAYKLGISPRTVQFHLNSIFNKTTTGTRTGAVTAAVKNGWL